MVLIHPKLIDTVPRDMGRPSVVPLPSLLNLYLTPAILVHLVRVRMSMRDNGFLSCGMASLYAFPQEAMLIALEMASFSYVLQKCDN